VGQQTVSLSSTLSTFHFIYVLSTSTVQLFWIENIVFGTRVLTANNMYLLYVLVIGICTCKMCMFMLYVYVIGICTCYKYMYLLYVFVIGICTCYRIQWGK